METETKTKYILHLRWYGTVNYLIALGEQIALWKYADRTFFWLALVLNVLSILLWSHKLVKLEKDLNLN